MENNENIQAAERYNLNRYLFNIDKLHFREENE